MSKILIVVSGLLLGLAAPCAAAVSGRMARVASSPVVVRTGAPALAAPALSVARPSPQSSPLVKPAVPVLAAAAAQPQASAAPAAFAQLAAEAPRIAAIGGDPSAQGEALDRFFDKGSVRAPSPSVIAPGQAAAARRPLLAKAAAARRQAGRIDPATVFTAAAVLGPVAAGAAIGARFGEAALLGLPGPAVAGVILGSLMLCLALLVSEDSSPGLSNNVRVLVRTGAAAMLLLGFGTLGAALGSLPLPVLAAIGGAAAVVLLILALMGNDYIQDRDRRGR